MKHMQPTDNNKTAEGIAPRKYTITKRFRDGHVFGRENATGRIWCGDQSGYVYDNRSYYPERTDDGILWLDISRPVTLIKRKGRYNHKLGGYFVSIPLLTPAGKSTATIGTDAEAAYCHKLGMDVQGQGDPFVAEIIAIKREAK